MESGAICSALTHINSKISNNLDKKATFAAEKE